MYAHLSLSGAKLTADQYHQRINGDGPGPGIFAIGYAICQPQFLAICHMPSAILEVMQCANSIYAFLAWLANFRAFIVLFSRTLSLPVAFLASHKGRPGKGSAGAWPARY
jgi:hypothetical protein